MTQSQQQCFSHDLTLTCHFAVESRACRNKSELRLITNVEDNATNSSRLRLKEGWENMKGVE